MVPVDVETNYPDVISIQRPTVDNKTHVGYENVFLEVDTVSLVILLCRNI